MMVASGAAEIEYRPLLSVTERVCVLCTCTVTPRSGAPADDVTVPATVCWAAAVPLMTSDSVRLMATASQR
jgi:hypothetical protein